MYIYYLYPETTETELSEIASNLQTSLEANQASHLEIEDLDEGLNFGFEGWGNLKASIYPKDGTTDTLRDAVIDIPHLKQRIKEYDCIKSRVSDSDIDNIEGEYVDRISDVVELIERVYNELAPKPAVTYGLTDAEQKCIHEMEGYGLPVTEDSLAAAELAHLPWLVILPPEIVTTYGRERLLETPVWKTKALDDGSVLLVSHVDILHQLDSSMSERNEHLGMESPISHML
ncbi:hypothetical protein [Halorubellus sp. PRR65]|uniref:hypothetical protein n=1 Tax=Halorubellus sp. PRR65 TaxID=3098148 RepID=UPI002B25CE39|nr:hypothetical protein [Halorubellus sp. PRR65]